MSSQCHNILKFIDLPYSLPALTRNDGHDFQWFSKSSPLIPPDLRRYQLQGIPGRVSEVERDASCWPGVLQFNRDPMHFKVRLPTFDFAGARPSPTVPCARPSSAEVFFGLKRRRSTVSSQRKNTCRPSSRMRGLSPKSRC